jgi:NAD(P)-dependent dehydrogenase (short-subunit alcohol dehydrogenase family)
MGQVEGMVAIVTGGGSGIGAACARTLACEGAMAVSTSWWPTPASPFARPSSI